jgi:hypothetical protein
MDWTKIVELKAREEIELLKRLIDKYHSQGAPRGGGAGRHPRFFVYVVEEENGEYWVAGAWLHDATPFRFVAQKLNIPQENSYFIRRICKFAPGDWLVSFLSALADRLKAEGKECLWTLGFKDHSNALYKLAGFTEVGKTARSGHPVYVLWLRKK